MLKLLGVQSEAELISQIIPEEIRLNQPLELDEPVTEQQHLLDMNVLASKNQLWKTYIGRGWYDTATPAVITRNVLENPVWYTSYTPYQAEVSQGRLEALFVFQTMISDLTGLPLANCSLLETATGSLQTPSLQVVSISVVR